MAGKRIAIVHEQSGVTRDRLMREVTRDDQRFELIDTGGVANIDRVTDPDAIETGVRQQVDAALQDATMAILVVDLETGVVPLDDEVAGLLRRSGVQTVLAANKADHPGRDRLADDFQRFGFPVFPVSALHNRGISDLVETVLGCLPEVSEENVDAEPLRVVVVGRPNVGKSSYINRLLRNNRIIVSSVPGTTRDSIDVPFTLGAGPQARRYLLIDTAGIRRLGKISTPVERFSRFRAEKSIDRADLAVLMVDATSGPTAQDKKIGSAIIEREKGCVVLVNKWDLATATQRQFGPELLRSLPFLAFCPVVFASAKTGYNIRRSVDAIDLVASQVRAELPTGMLTRTLIDAHERTQAPAAKGKRLKVFYATQVGDAPVRVRVFVNDPTIVKAPYRSYLEKTVRRRFGLEGAPLVLQFRARRDREPPSDGPRSAARRPSRHSQRQHRRRR